MQILPINRVSPGLMMTFGTWLKTERNKRGWTQRLLADKAGISSAMVARLEKNNVGHSPDMVKRLVEALSENTTLEGRAGILRSAKIASAGLPDKPPEEVQIDVAELLSLYSSLSPERKIRVLEKAADQYMLEQYEAREEMSRK
jgi:transcriptional regulator with XRE-family HTH domain